jgi:hypothetical protein
MSLVSKRVLAVLRIAARSDQEEPALGVRHYGASLSPARGHALPSFKTLHRPPGTEVVDVAFLHPSLPDVQHLSLMALGGRCWSELYPQECSARRSASPVGEAAGAERSTTARQGGRTCEKILTHALCGPP